MSLNRSRTIAAALIAVGLIAALACVAMFPEVEGLGGRVRLPIFHGAMTWVNLVAFALLGIFAVGSLVSGKPSIHFGEEGLRYVSIPLWIIGSALGLMAALNTWDFTGSKSSRFEVVAADPRLMAQFWIMLAGLVVLVVCMMLEDDRKVASVLDISFVGFAWFVLLRAILGPGRALHPDSPVLNSDEILIKALFFGVVGSLALATFAASWLIASWRSSRSLAAADASGEA